jgi:hypothetical protein
MEEARKYSEEERGKNENDVKEGGNWVDSSENVTWNQKV